ncbi:prokaryotic cytochrome b561 family protein [Asticcacaulis biprosthecium C19]|uniref:Prokaryotic cytochrome b561 family protein n=1 Tax=Asticcacaulis biprosthecium C19 TaxID=715226 RepID=F4QT52_9CAUL|nr:YceI family protein [Asticcacaulis biprosthecium]EGF89922.1 prokaryotic cytochrome b561 family protein [Asticcacaulis biprosthecium C19]
MSDSPLTTTSYNAYSRWLHWILAFLILFMIFLGWSLEDQDTLRRTRFDLHKSVGMLILLLSFVRIGVRLAYKAPPEPPMPRWQALAAKALHIGFYVVMIGMPLSGWLLVSTNVRPIPFFGLFDWPHLPVPKTEALHEFFEEGHHLIAKLIIYGMVPLHVLAALKHQFVDKDTVMQHMVPGLTPKPILNWRWILPVGIIVAAFVLGRFAFLGKPVEKPAPPPTSTASTASTAPAEASATASQASASETSSVSEKVTSWTVDKAASSIRFATSLEGDAINGSFGGYSARIDFDPEQLDKSRVKVTIDLASATTGNSDYDGTMKGPDFFNVPASPKAEFEAKSFTRKDATRYVAHGTLKLRGVSKKIDLPFTLTIKNGVADMTASVDIDRTAYGVGAGAYAGTDAVPAKVPVTIKLRARAA